MIAEAAVNEAPDLALVASVQFLERLEISGCKLPHEGLVRLATIGKGGRRSCELAFAHGIGYW
jgi:hypothetical protein